ncbi:mitogen-activated kinase kinase kinase [Anaeramoeba flamelloides]|uniref:Mitogen-activated kinase kinase kinase n=1 Tax=Anaeramoeba flamelloides TaxID=1746091 RepID=A0AAV7Z5F0_9EUKA|nr:mitogen-activated kinase kinase kinase [Anaeramoeba flamelloides]
MVIDGCNSKSLQNSLRIREDGALISLDQKRFIHTLTTPTIMMKNNQIMEGEYQVQNETNCLSKLILKPNSLSISNCKSPLLVDPLKYSSFFGGTGKDFLTDFSISDFAIDFTVVCVGMTTSPDIPKFGGLLNVNPPSNDLQTIMFILTFDISGGIIVSSYFGGLIEEKNETVAKYIIPRSVSRSKNPSFWIVGSTNMNGIPLTENSFMNFNIDKEIGFILHLNRECDKILYSSFLGGIDDQSETRLLKVKQDQENKIIFLGGMTNSNSSLLFKNEIQPVANIIDGENFYLYLAAIKPGNEKTTLIFGTQFGGTKIDRFTSFSLTTLDTQEETYLLIGGSTSSPDFFQFYNTSISPDVTIFNDNKIDNGKFSGFFLKIKICETNDDLKLLAGGFLGFDHDEAILSTAFDYSFASRQLPIKNGPLTFAGKTGNWDTFPGDGNIIRPDWMFSSGSNGGELKSNDGQTEVGFVIRLNPEATSIDYGFLFGCEYGNTTILTISANISDIIIVSGLTNCDKDDLQMKNDIWDMINLKEDVIHLFPQKSFVLKLNISKLDETNISYLDNIFFSSFVDGINNNVVLLFPNDYFPTVKVDNNGNIYSFRSLYQDYYFNSECKITENSIMSSGVGNFTIMFRIYSGINCHPGSTAISDTDEDESKMGLCWPTTTGYYSIGFDSRDTIACETGYYQDQVKSTSCNLCPDDTISSQGQRSCVLKSCPPTPLVWVNNVKSDSITVNWNNKQILSNNYYNYNQEEEENYDYDGDDQQLFLIKLFSPPAFGLTRIANQSEASLNGNLFTLKIDGLESITRYYLKIKSFYVKNTNLESAWSNDLPILTLPYPSRISYSSINIVPGYNYLNVSWEEPYTNGENPIIEYIISYYSTDETLIKHIITENTETQITDLVLGVDYHVAIQGTNSAGEGPLSIFKSSTTQKQVPTIVKIVNIQISQKQINLTWEQSLPRGSEITKYQLKIKETSSLVNFEPPTDPSENMFYSITDLSRSTKYTISIFAINSIGYSESNAKVYETESLSKWVQNSIILIGVLLIIIIVLLFLLKNNLSRNQRKSQIKKIIKKQKSLFEKKLLRNIKSSGETMVFQPITERLIHQLVMDIENGKCVEINDGNYIVLNDQKKRDLIFCKETIHFEERIYKKIWKIFLSKPQKLPLIQFIGSANFEKTTISNSIKNYKKNKKNINKNNDDDEDEDGNDDDDDDDDDDDSDNDINDQETTENRITLKTQNTTENMENINKKLIIALEYLPYSLEDFILKRKKINLPFTNQEKCFLALNILNGLKFLQKNRIIHRDIKPRNILIGFDGFLRIVDFDTAIRLHGEKSFCRRTFAGTHEYFDPFCVYAFDAEKGKANYIYTFAHDLYSVGKTLKKIEFLSMDNNLDSKNLNTNIFKNTMNGDLEENEDIEKESLLSQDEIEVDQIQNNDLNPLPELIQQCCTDLKHRPNVKQLLKKLKKWYDY